MAAKPLLRCALMSQSEMQYFSAQLVHKRIISGVPPYCEFIAYCHEYIKRSHMHYHGFTEECEKPHIRLEQSLKSAQSSVFLVWCIWNSAEYNMHLLCDSNLSPRAEKWKSFYSIYRPLPCSWFSTNTKSSYKLQTRREVQLSLQLPCLQMTGFLSYV